MKRVVPAIIAIMSASVFAANTPKPEIKWATDLSASLKRAEKENKWVFLYFYTDWCGYCKKLDGEVFSDDKVEEVLSKFVLVRVNGDKQTEVRDRFEVDGYPNLIVLDGKGVMLERIGGFLPKKQFLEVIEPISRGVNPLETLKKRLSSNPDDGKIQIEGGVKLIGLRQYDLASQALERAVKVLPSDDKTHLAAMVYLFQIYVNAGKPSQADAELAEIEKSHPGVVNQKAAQIFVGKAYSKAGDQEQAIRIWEKSLSELEDDGMKNAVRKMISDAKVPPATAEGVSSASKEK